MSAPLPPVAEEQLAAPPARGGIGRPLLFVVKFSIAALLLTWLHRRGALDFAAMRVLVADPTLLVANLAAWLLAAVLLSTYRWRLLLRLAGVELPLARATALQTMALFLNLVIPGNVGGDVVKVLWVGREVGAKSRAPFLLLAVVERVLGLLGLIFMAVFVALLHYRSLLLNDGMRPLLYVLAVLALGGVVGPFLLIMFLRRYGDGAEALAARVPKIGGVLSKLVAAMRLVLAQPRVLVMALAVSMTMHGIAMAFFTLLTRAIVGLNVDYGLVATVFPIGLLTTVLPISPGGIGVGHVAFERLYHLVGLTGGATVFNVFLIGQLVPCLIGAIPYLFMRQRASSTDA